MRRLELIAAMFTVISVLTACAGGPKPAKSLTPVCTALIGPIHYNTFNPKSQRYAGKQLAPDLQRRNEVGQYLACPQYRRW